MNPDDITQRPTTHPGEGHTTRAHTQTRILLEKRKDPLLEAMSQGTPVFRRRAPLLTEIKTGIAAISMSNDLYLIDKICKISEKRE